MAQAEFNRCLAAVCDEFKVKPSMILERKPRSPMREAKVMLMGLLTEKGWTSDKIALCMDDMSPSSVRNSRAKHYEFKYHWRGYSDSLNRVMEKADE